VWSEHTWFGVYRVYGLGFVVWGLGFRVAHRFPPRRWRCGLEGYEGSFRSVPIKLAGTPIAGGGEVARVARACVGADGVGAVRVVAAGVGPLCDRGARPSALQSRPSVSGPFSIQIRPHVC
jgi:hypothetical protein